MRNDDDGEFTMAGFLAGFGFAAFVVFLLLFVFIAGCGGTMHKTPEHPHPVKEWVGCMMEPPPVEAIDWPAPDTVGNLLMHASTAERVKAAYAALVKWTRANYYRCLHEMEAKGIDTTTIEVEGLLDGGL